MLSLVAANIRHSSIECRLSSPRCGREHILRPLLRSYQRAWILAGSHRKCHIPVAPSFRHQIVLARPGSEGRSLFPTEETVVAAEKVMVLVPDKRKENCRCCFGGKRLRPSEPGRARIIRGRKEGATGVWYILWLPARSHALWWDR